MSAVRDEMRGKIFSVKARTKEVLFNGVVLELRQPPVGSIIAGNEEDKRAVVARMIIDNCFIPGTGEKVFEEADYETLMNMPFGADWMNLSKAMDELTDISKSLEEQGKN